MSLNLLDPSTIIGAYESTIDIRNTNNWLLLHYSKFDELALFDNGSGGLRELKRSIQDLGQIYIGFYREEIGAEPGFILINYIPPSTPAVKKARALVHSRRVSAVFKRQQTTLTVDDLSKLTAEAIHRALGQDKEPDSPNSVSTFKMSRANTNLPSHPRPNTANSPPIDKNKSLPNPSPGVSATDSAGPFVIEPVRRAASESHMTHSTAALSLSAPLQAKSAGMFSSFIKRKKKTEEDVSEDDLPPPAPPKDKSMTIQTPQYTTSYQKLTPVRDPSPSGMPYEVPQRSRTGSLSEYAVISHASSSNVGGHPEIDEFGYQQLAGGMHSMSLSADLRGKWGTEPMDAAERLRKRQEEIKRRQLEEEAARQEEERRKQEKKRRKEHELRELAEAEARRRASIEDEVQRLAAERKRRERSEREEEERKRREIEERKRIDRARRSEEHRRLEEWRTEQAQLADESKKRADEIRRKEEVERKRKIQIAEAKVQKHHNVDSLISGWVTMQTNDSLLWKRRFYKFIGTAAYFYRSPKDPDQYLDKVELRGNLRGLKEWSDGYEDLQAIPCSFAIEFKDGKGHWSMFSDSEEEKYKLLGLLHHAAGL